MQIRNSVEFLWLLKFRRFALTKIRPERSSVNPLVRLPPAALEYVAQYFRALSEPTRLHILSVLEENELSVGEIAEAVDSSVANVSRHLAQMAQRGLVARSQEGSSVLYRIADPAVQQLCDLVCNSIARRFEQTAEARAAFEVNRKGERR